MNTSIIEQCFAAALQVAAPSRVEVLQASDSGEVPATTPFITVFVEQCDNVVGGLWKATVSAIIVSPAPLFTALQHADIVTTVANYVKTNALYSNYNISANGKGHTCGGGKLLSSESDPEGGSYRHTIKVLLGLLVS